jgi:hypothetical protein
MIYAVKERDFKTADLSSYSKGGEDDPEGSGS